MEVVRGYKVFNPDWTCRGKQYSCPGKYEEEVNLKLCTAGMHFCKIAADCFNYCKFDPSNKVAEVIAYGEVIEVGDKCCTDKLEIVREVPWTELLEIVNAGRGCTGLRNSGNGNSGHWNSGDWNSGDWNSGNRNSGDWNSGDWNSGDLNSGHRNSGDWNSGDWNSGDLNSGHRNSGDWNSGNWNSGDWNSGNWNSGDWNSGDWNSGNWNSGDWNSGDWNIANHSNGCFNTVAPKIFLFDKPSDWTYEDWLDSEARHILATIPSDFLEWVSYSNMTESEKEAYPEAKITGGYLKFVNCLEKRVVWWSGLSKKKKSIIKAIPNFDKEIFKEITGIDVDE